MEQNQLNETKQPEKTIQIKVSDEVLRGVYANAMTVSHTKEEFILDFLNLFPPQGIVNTRVIMNPGHLKRVAAVLADSLKKYEGAFGKIAESESPENQLGFRDRGK
ncbi:MAG: DUF3467 domain-containing protein [bacterium]